MDPPLRFECEIPPELVEAIALRAAELVESRVEEVGPWLTAPEAAEYLRCPLSRIYHLNSLGRIPVHRDGSRLKAHDVAFQRAMLGVTVSDRFADPDRAYRLYDEVRSDAVHGGAPELDTKEFRAFSWDVRIALTEYIQLARREGFQTRRRLLRYLRSHPQRSRLQDWLLENGDESWGRYFRDRGN